jgi:hypothetical protein
VHARNYKWATHLSDQGQHDHLAVHPLSGATTNNKAVFNGKAGIQYITDPNNIISVDGNASLQLNMVDNGTPGTNDTLGITL